ncbi:MAG: bile acid:sodium symporter [Lentisphaeria bacterium]|nr:bile acid:sodium symporter [Lentisphaeria bacterium]
MNVYKIVKKTFLPAGLVLAVLLACIVPEFGIKMKSTIDQNIFIVIVFVVCGIQTSLSDLHITKKSLFFLVCGGILTLFLCPLFAWGITLLLGLASLQAAGLIVAAAAPPTLSSGIVMTETAGGNHVTAIAITMLYNLAAVFTIPVVLAFAIASDAGINTNPWNMLKKLFLLVVLPFAAGFVFKTLIRMKKSPSWLSFVSSFAVIALILFFFSASSDKMKAISAMVLLKGFIASIIIHFACMASFWYGAKALKLPVEECKAYLFTAASKTLTIALTTLAIIGAGDGDAVAPCIIFYFFQMIFDSFLAAKMGLSGKENPAEQTAKG